MRLGILSLEVGEGSLPPPFSSSLVARVRCAGRRLHSPGTSHRDSLTLGYPNRGTRTRTRTFEHATFERDHSLDEEDTLDSLVSESDSGTGCDAGATDLAAARRACSA